jgi:hypothetical protein
MARPKSSTIHLARLALALAVLLVAPSALAAPESHILRIDPRAGISGGKPVLTTVIEVVEAKRMTEVLQPCAGERGFEATATCWSEKIETPGALWSPFPLPEAAAHLLVNVNGEDRPATFVDKDNWGKLKAQPNIGTAWLIALDASAGMGARYAEAQKVAYEFIQSMQQNDLMDLMIFDDRQVIKDSKWKAFKDRNAIVQILQSQAHVADKHGNDRPLFEQIKGMTKDGFGSLGNSDAPDAIPLHQAMVVLSNGSGRGDAASASPSAEVFHQYLDDGRFGSNDAMPKTPLPVISIWFPNRGGGIVTDLYKNNDAQFMQALGNPEIGGFFDIVQEGQGDSKGKTIIGLVRKRFDAMWVVHWRLACLSPTVLQSFSLVFESTKPQIAPDASFKNVPLGVNPTEWPLDIDFDKTMKEAQANPLYPGGQFRVYGDFCWGGDKGRAEAYFIPAGTKASPTTNNRDPELAKKAMQQLIAQNMRGGGVDVGDAFALMQVPDDDKILEGSGDATVARVVLYDNKAKRASAVDAKTVLSLKAMKKPLPWLIILAVALGVIGILLLVIVLMRSGGSKPKRGGAPPPYAPPQGGYGGAPGGSGAYGGAPGAPYQMQAEPAFAGAAAAMSPASAPMAPAAAAMAPPVDTATPAVVQVRCPACSMMTMATPGQPSVCFSCGQPLPADITGGGGAGAAPTFPLTGAISAVVHQPPPSPYAASPASATISSTAGQFVIRPGGEVRVGRDPGQCPIFLSEPRVSGVHSSLKLEGAELWVRDETSNNGTYVSGTRIAPGAWVVVPQGASLRFGPIEFSVKLEG